jgi:hypothetical protein
MPISVPDSGAYRIAIEAKTTKFWGLFYPIDNFYWTYLDTIGNPLYYKREIDEKSLKKTTEQDFDHSLNRIYYEGNTAIDHPGRLENFFSGLYGLRAAELKEGYSDSFYVNVEQASWLVKVAVEGTDEMRAGDYDIECHRIDVKFKQLYPEARRLPSDALSYNLISEDTELKIYLSNDDWHLPIRMDYKLSPFDVKAVITEFPEGYPEQLEKQ